MQEPFDLSAEDSEPDPDPELPAARPESGNDPQASQPDSSDQADNQADDQAKTGASACETQVPEILDEAQWEDAWAEMKTMSVPRQSVRAEQALQAERLRDKMAARAEIVGDTVSESILAKCNALEIEGQQGIVEKLKKVA